MAKKFDIYITYPDNLSKAFPGIHDLILLYIKNLKVLIRRLAGRDLSIISKENELSTKNAKTLLRDSSLALFFFHPSFSGNEEYESELRGICEYFQFEHPDPLKKYNKIFKVCLEPSGGRIEPACLEKLMSYDFFEKNVYNRKVKSLDFRSENQVTGLYGKLLDLSRDLAESLAPPIQNASDQYTDSQYVYLGLTSADQQKARDELQRELQYLGFEVLPFVTMPSNGAEFMTVLQTNLQRVNVVIQLMGTQYGDIMKGTKYSVPDYQNQGIKEFLKQESGKPIKRFIWIPQKVKVMDQRQALYLKRLKRDDADQETEIIESSLESFKTILAGKIKYLLNHSNPVEPENTSKIYLVTEENTEPEVDEINARLKESGLKVYMLDYSVQAGIYARHLHALKDSDSVLIYQKSRSKFWLDSKLRDLIKSPGTGRKKPFKKVVICSDLIPESNLMKMIHSEVEVLNRKKINPDLILQKILSV